MGNNYYDVNELGHISVCPDPDVPEARVDLAELVKAREAQGSACRHCSASRRFCNTACVRLTPRLNARVSPMAITATTSVYPIKVNQHRRVIESLIHSGEPLGLEAGSKAELMAVLAHAGMTRA